MVGGGTTAGLGCGAWPINGGRNGRDKGGTSGTLDGGAGTTGGATVRGASGSALATGEAT